MVPANAHFPEHAGGRKPAAAATTVGVDAKAVQAFERRVVEFFMGAADVMGVPKSVAAIYGVIFASPRPVCFVDIEARLRISKGSISQGLRFLRKTGAVKAVDGVEDRRGYFEPDMKLRKLLARLLREKFEPQLSGSGEAIDGLARTIPFADEGDTKVLQGRLKQLQTWHRKARDLVPFVKVMLAIGQD